MGFITAAEADKYLKGNRTWREESRLPGLFFHGKDAHRIQLAIIMYAIELGLIKFSAEKPFQKILNLLRCSDTETGEPLWNPMLDSIYSANHEMISPMPDFKNRVHPVFKNKVNQKISNILSANDSDFFLGMDPYYIHSYLMKKEAIDNDKFPCLKACTTNTFVKTTEKINRLQNNLKIIRSPDGVNSTFTYTYQNKITVDETLKEQENFYNTADTLGASATPSVIASQNFEKGHVDNDRDLIVNSQSVAIVKEYDVASNQTFLRQYALADTKGFVFFKNEITKDNSKKPKKNLFRAFLELEPKGLDDATIQFLINFRIVTAEQYNTLTICELYKKLRERIQIALQPEVVKKIKVCSDEELSKMKDNEIIEKLHELISNVRPVKLRLELYKFLDNQKNEISFKI